LTRLTVHRATDLTSNSDLVKKVNSMPTVPAYQTIWADEAEKNQNCHCSEQQKRDHECLLSQ